MVWTVVPDMNEIDAKLREIGPMGYSLVINLRGLTPEHYVSTFPTQWVARYTERQYALFDPVNIWARTNTGRIRWSEIPLDRYARVSASILEFAAEYGLAFGGGVSRSKPEESDTLSFLFCARSDRELSDAELAETERLFEQILTSVEKAGRLSTAELSTLEDMANGLSYKEIADIRHISQETVKKRLNRIRITLGARNSVHAVAIATKRGLILNYPVTGPRQG